MIPEKYQANPFFRNTLPKIFFAISGVALLLLVYTLFTSGAGDGHGAHEAHAAHDAHGGHDHGGHGSPLKKFFHSYLFSYIFYMGIIFGAVFFIVLQFLTSSGWSVLIRRVSETFLKNIWIMIPLTIPIFFGLYDLYHWTHAEAVAEDYILQFKSPYLNVTFFSIRVVIYLVVLFVIANYYYRNSVKQDKTADQTITVKLQRYSSVSMILFALVITFFAIDFVMSLDPHWYSTIWGVYYFAGSFTLLLSFTIIIIISLKFSGKLEEVNAEHFHDLGKFLFTFVVFWSYIAFSQYMLIWYANIPEETLFYLNRINGTWRDVSYLLVLGHVIFPIIALVSRNVKRNMKTLLFMAIWMVLIQIVDFYWLVMPNVDVTGIHLDSTDVLVFVSMGGLFFGWFFRNFGKNAIVPFNDPRIKESINLRNA